MVRDEQTPSESSRSYPQALNRWVESTLPHGRSALFSISALVTVTCLFLFGLNIISILAPVEPLPLWMQTVPYVIGGFAGYTGWKYAKL